MKVSIIAVQITDYGLPSFLAGQNFDENEQDAFRRESVIPTQLCSAAHCVGLNSIGLYRDLV